MNNVAHSMQSSVFTRAVTSLSLGPWTTAGQLIADSNALNSQLTTQQYINIIPFTPNALLNLAVMTGTTPCVFQATTGSGNNYVGTGAYIGFDVLLSSNTTVAMPLYGTNCWVRARQPNPLSGGPWTLSFVPYTTLAAFNAASGNAALVTANGGAFTAPQTVQTWYNPAGNVVAPPSMLSGPSASGGAVDFYQFTRANTSSPWKAVVYQDLTYLGAGSQEYVWQCPVSSTSVKLPNPVVAVGSDITLTNNCAVQMPTGYVGLQCWCIVRQGPLTGATPSIWNVGFGSSTLSGTPQAVTGSPVTWTKGIQPVMSAGANAVDLYQFVWDPVTTVNTATGSQTGVWMGIPLQGFALPTGAPH